LNDFQIRTLFRFEQFLKKEKETENKKKNRTGKTIQKKRPTPELDLVGV
jgi:hypothetical protein